MYRLCLAFITYFAIALSAQAAQLVSPNDMGMGALLLKSNEPGKYLEAPRVASDYEISINGPIARTRVTQQFHNPADGWIEGVYVFPLPENAAVDTLKMVIGDRVIIGDIKERQEAKQIFEEAKAKGEKAALLEQERPNIFTNPVANIGPRETIVVQIEYQQPVRQSAGVFSLRVPMVVGPRYIPKPEIQVSENGQFFAVVDRVPDAERLESPVLDPRKHKPVNPITIAVHLNAGFTLGDVMSSYHDVNATAVAADHKEITLSNPEFADRDFELTWAAKPGAEPAVGLFSERIGDADYALAYVSPPEQPVSEIRMPREVVFVIDNSGSMGGPSMAQAKGSLIYALSRLDPKDKFNVIRFDDTMDILFPDAVQADLGNVEKAKYFVGGLEASGGTEMIPPLRAALRDASPEDQSLLRQVIFLTDGAIGNEQEMFDVLSSMRGRSRVFMVGIGSAPNSSLMTRAAELGRGSFTQIGDGSQVEDRMRELIGKLESPAVTELKASVDQGDVEITPAMLPDVYRGEPVMMLMKMKERKGTLTLAGKIGGKPWTTTLALNKATAGSGIAKLWARRKIDDAEVAQSIGRLTPEGADKEILAVALEHHLVSRVTSLVAIDKTPARAPGEKLTRSQVPINLPAGWDYDKVFGEQPQTFEKDAKLDLTLIAMSKTKPMPAQQNAVKELELPQGSTLSDLFLLLGALLSAFAVALALYARCRTSQ
jgi:Ca-activated chloride channel homolog